MKVNQKNEQVDLVAAAAELKVPWHTAHRWVLVGKLQGERRDGHWSVDRESLKRLCAERSQEPQPAA